MKESLVTSLKTSEGLQELGFRMDSEFIHVLSNEWTVELNNDTWEGELYPAYLAGELAEALPEEIDYLCLKITKDSDQYSVIYDEGFDPNGYYKSKTIIQEVLGISLAEAMGLMLIHLLEEGLIK